MEKCITKIYYMIPTIIVTIALLLFAGLMFQAGGNLEMPFLKGLGLFIIALAGFISFGLRQVFSFDSRAIYLGKNTIELSKVEDYDIVEHPLGKRILMTGSIFFWLIPSEIMTVEYSVDSSKKKFKFNSKLTNYRELADLIIDAKMGNIPQETATKPQKLSSATQTTTRRKPALEGKEIDVSHLFS